MSGDGYEPNRFLGFPIRPKPQARQDGEPDAASQGEEPQRVMGFPVDWSGPAGGSLADPIRKGWRWLRRRLGDGSGGI
jgi:hypothetical protein